MAMGATLVSCQLTNHDGQRVQVSTEECATCHMPEYEATTMPPHPGAFPPVCQTCHTIDAWVPATIVHDWPLEGGHDGPLCTACHNDEPPVYEGLSSLCVSCHQDDYDGSTFPGHDAFPDTCQDCHTIVAWQPADFGHEWPLNGAHLSTPCTSCHLGEPPVYEGTPTLCIGCHQDDYDGSTFPGHDAFPDTCQDCHTTAAWQPANFDHSWPLTGAHVRTSCLSCHLGTPPVYEGTPMNCVDCHQDDYDTSPFPGHDAFQTTCQDCHSTNAWTPAMGGNHPDDAFPIGGRHDYACNECHDVDRGSPVDGINTDCVGCHEGEHRRGNVDNDHSEVSGYPGADAPPNFCLDCHPDGNN